MTFSMTAEPIESRIARSRRDAGGYVVFEGRVRDHNDGRAVERLEYESHGELAQIEGVAILEEAARKFEILDADCVHRTGILEIGEIAIRLEVAAAHRKAAFDAAAWIVDEIKARVPIWKKEHYATGESGWIGV